MPSNRTVQKMDKKKEAPIIKNKVWLNRLFSMTNHRKVTLKIAWLIVLHSLNVHKSKSNECDMQLFGLLETLPEQYKTHHIECQVLY